MSSKDLPHDLVLEILVCLPVKSLFRFRCVSKLWYSSITNRNFIDAHLKKANLLRNKNGYFVYKHAKYFHGLTEANYFHGLTELCMVSCNSDNTVTEVSRYGFLCCPHSSILGVCNGVVCLKRPYGSIINLWNPTIKKLNQLPFVGYEPRFKAFGFAYDSQNNDYKIITIKSNIDYFSYEGVPLIEAAVYTLSSNSWRKLKQPITGKSSSLSISYMAGTNPVFFNGALHWIASSDNDNRVVYPFIVAFDVNDEKFRLIMLPPNASIDSLFLSHVYLVDYKGSLALITYHVDYKGSRGFITTGVKVIWIMKEYGVFESWTKQIVEDADSLDPMIKYSKNFHFRNDSSIVHTTNTIESLVLADEY